MSLTCVETWRSSDEEHRLAVAGWGTDQRRQQAVAEPGRRSGPAGQIGDQLDAPRDRHVLIDQQIDDQRTNGGPVAARRYRNLRRPIGDILAAAPAAHPVQIMLAHPDPDLGQVMDLMRALDAHLGRAGQVGPAAAGPLASMSHALVGVARPRQGAARRARLLAPRPPGPFRPPPGRLRPPG
jgi:hypothetical protein